MKQTNSNSITVKWVVSLMVSIGVGTFIMNLLEKVELNVWIARGLGGLVTVMVILPLYYLWINKTR